MRAAASPLPSAMPPAATTGMVPAASTTAGTKAKVPRETPWPPPSAPWATRTCAVAHGFLRLGKRLHLTDKQRAGALDLLGMRSDVAKGKHHSRRAAFERHIEHARPFGQT